MVGVPEPGKGEVCALDTGSGRLLTRIPVGQGPTAADSNPGRPGPHGLCVTPAGPLLARPHRCALL